MADVIDQNTVVSHTDDRGRTLSGVGVEPERLEETMERHAPPAKTPPEPPAGKPAAPPPAAESGATPAAPVSRGRQRFSDLTRERDEAKAAADAAKAEREQIARERDELQQRLERGVPRETAQPAQPEVAVTPEPTRPMPTEDDIGTKYKTYADFVDDRARWVYEQQAAAVDYRSQIREALAEERAYQAFNSAVQDSQTRAKKAYPDFEALLKGPAGNIPLGPNRDAAVARAGFVFRHPQSEHIQYAILKDAKLAETLRDSDDVTFGMTIASLANTPEASAARNGRNLAIGAATGWTPPPAPHPTVGASSPTTAPTHEDIAKKGFDFDKSGYREKRAAELGRRRRW